MPFSLEGRRALVLGASRGLGFAIANAFAGAGAKVAVVSRSAEAADAAAQKIGRGAKGHAWDTGNVDGADALHRAIVADLGGIDILLLNSGGPKPGTAQGVASADWRAAFDAMFVGLVRLADLALPQMAERKFGRIVSIISSGVIEPIPNLAISNTIRPALVGWGKTLASEVAKHGVTVNAIAPGRIATDRLAQLDANNAERTGRPLEEVKAASAARIPVGRYGKPEEFAAMALFLASDEAAFVTGSVLRVDGGQIAAAL
jgi:3-oxoacyl-[acyl-carrier protein] reductase